MTCQMVKFSLLYGWEALLVGWTIYCVVRYCLLPFLSKQEFSFASLYIFLGCHSCGIGDGNSSRVLVNGPPSTGGRFFYDDRGEHSNATGTYRSS